MTTILHVIQQLSLGGAARSLIATSKYSARLGGFQHKALSLAPAEPDALTLAKEAGLEVIAAPDAATVLREMAQADIVQVHWWNNAVLQTILHWDLPPMRLLMWYHVAGNAAPQVIIPPLVALADCNVATNPYTYDELPVFRDMPAADRASRLAMIYDPADFARLEDLQPKAHDDFQIGYIGTVDSYKMHPNFIPMSAGIRIPSARFVVCGGGRENELQREAQVLGAAARFDFRGYVKDIRPVLETLDVFGYPLCQNTYASGELTIQEAMFAGVPPVAFPHGGLRRLIVHDETGILVDTEKEYQEAIEHLFHHPEQRARLARNASEFARQTFGAENAAHRLNPLYERLLHAPKRQRFWNGGSLDITSQPGTTAPDRIQPRQPLTGAEIFLESLGDQASQFRVSWQNDSLPALLRADEVVARAPRLVQHTGVFAYRIGYPEDPWLTFWQGLAALENGDAKSALQDFASAIKHGFPHWRIYWHLAKAALACGEESLALEALQMALANDPEFHEAHLLRETLIERSASALAPNSTPQEMTQPKTKSEPPPNAPSSAPQVQALAAEAQDLWKSGNLTGARDILRQALAFAPDEAELHLAIGNLELQLHDRPAAWPHLKRAAESSAHNDEIQVLFSAVSLELGKCSDAETALNGIFTRNPHHLAALRLLAQYQFQSRQIQKSARTCFSILELEESDIPTLTLLARCFQETGDADSARLTWERIVTIDPEHAEARAHLPASPSQHEFDVASLSLTGLASPPADAPRPVEPAAQRPKVSVLVSSYNSATCLQACLEDLERQTIADQLEIIVIDSGSEQNEKDVVETFQKRYDNIRYLRTERETLYAAWNRGLALANGEFITNANTDDAHHPDALAKQVAALESHSDADLVYVDAIDTWVPNDSFAKPHAIRRVRYDGFQPAFALFYCPLACHPMWRADVFRKLGGFDPAYHGPGDYEFFLRFVKAGLKAVHLPEPLSLFYKNPDGLSFQSVDRSRWENERVLRKYRSEIPIERLYRIAPGDQKQTALAWTALGNLAMCHEVPWFDNPQQDLAYARCCYQHALRCDSECAAAASNLVMLLGLVGQLDQARQILQSLPPNLSAELQTKLSSGHLYPTPVDLPPAVEYPTHGNERNAGVDGAHRNARESQRATPATPANSTVVRWIGPLAKGSEFGYAARQSVHAIFPEFSLGAFDQSDPSSDSLLGLLTPSLAQTLHRSRRRLPFLTGGVAVMQQPAPKFSHTRNAHYHIGYTWTEADGIPTDWVTSCNCMDEVWVPSHFHMEAFARSGVSRHKIQVMPGATDETLFDPQKTEPLEAPRDDSFRFLAVFEWSHRAGWDVLLKSYLEEFAPDDRVCLCLRTWMPEKPEEDGSSKIAEEFQSFLRRHGYADQPIPRIEFLTRPMRMEEEPRVYQSAQCLVNPSRGEGCGRVLREAMMMELPVIATGWGAFDEHLAEERSWRIQCDLQPAHTTEQHIWACRGQQWAAPSVRHLRQLLRHVSQHPEVAKSKGCLSRDYALQHFSHQAFASSFSRRMEEIRRKLEAPHRSPSAPVFLEDALSTDSMAAERNTIEVFWEGSFLDSGSLSHVNRELSSRLAECPGTVLTRVGKNNVPRHLGGMPEFKAIAETLVSFPASSPDVTIRHAWPPSWQAPKSGAWVLIQPWEFGVAPADWIQHIRHVDEVWVPSEFVRHSYIDSGIPPSKIHVVPNGIDPERFHPNAAPRDLPTTKSYKFLFVGGTIYRKGPDVLLDAYLKTFTNNDDVCLVIKDFGGDSIYAGQTLKQRIELAQADPHAPEILYLKDELSPSELPSLYTACDCLVHPYRGEGFGLPILEAMACGLPVIVTGGGASDDFVTDDIAYRIPATRLSIGNEVGGMRLAHGGWLLEPSLPMLAARMKWVFDHPDDGRKRGQSASVHAREKWTWTKAAAVASGRLHRLVENLRTHAANLALRRARPGPPIQLPNVARVGILSKAETYLCRQDLHGAWDQAMEALSLRPFHPEAYLLLSRIAATAGDLDLARKCAVRAKAMAPGWKDARQFLKSIKGTRSTVSFLPSALPESLRDPKTSLPSKLSVCLIAKNEERFIGQCLESVRQLADQIIVVDTGSTDWTCSIAARYGAEIRKVPWTDDFSAARNAALELARGDWVLMIDADEELPASSVARLKEEMSRADTMAWRIRIVDHGKESQGCSHVPRLFRNAPGLFYVGRIHEQIFSSLEILRSPWGLQNRLGQTTLIHHGYGEIVVRDRDKIARNLRLLELALQEIPNDPNLMLNHGLELIRSGHLDEGIDQYWEAFHVLSLRPAEERVPELVETLLTQLSAQLLQRKAFGSIVSLLQSPLAQEPNLSSSLHFTYGLALLEERDFAPAVKQFAACLDKRRQPSLTPVNPQVLGTAPRHCLAICHWKLGRRPAADQAFLLGRKEGADSRLLDHDYALFLADCDRPLDALKILHDRITLDAGDSIAWVRGGRIALSQPEFREFAVDWTGQAIKWFPGEPAIIEQRAEALLLAGQIRESIPLWKQIASSRHPRACAALALVELANQGSADTPDAAEQSVSKEFLLWYRRLIQYEARAVVAQLNKQLHVLAAILPTAHGTIQKAIREAEGESYPRVAT